MAETLMSEGERLFIVHSVEDDCRVDGRRCLESRKLRLESSIMANCHGSSRIRVGKTDLLVGVKAQIESPETTGKARIVFAADCSANASPAFEGRGGEDLASEIVSLLQKSFEPCLDLESLCLSPGKSVWVLTVDLLILEFGSKANLIDAAGIAVKAALFDTRIPKVIFDEEVGDLEVPEDPTALTQLDISRLPLLVTATKIGGHYVIDANEIEEASSVSSVVFAIDPEGEIIHIKKVGSGSLFINPLKENWKHFKEHALTLHADLSHLLQLHKK